MPKEPVSSSARTWTTSPISATSAIGVVIIKRISAMVLRRSFAGGGFALARFIYRANHIERRFGQIVTFTLQDRTAAAQRVGQLDGASLLAGERFGHGEG